MLGESYRFKGRVELDLPRCVFRGVRAFARIMFGHAVLEISRMPAIELLRLRDALEDIGIEHGVLYNYDRHDCKG